MAVIDRLDRQIEGLKARRAAVVARERERDRKRDSRRKIIIGGALLGAVRDGDDDARALYARLRAELADRDATLFAGWEADPVAASDARGGRDD